MKLQWTLVLSLLVLGCGVMNASSEDAPKGNKDFKASKTTVVELGPEFSAMAGHQLRMRVLTIQPGGYIGLHSHKDRPSVVYFMQGTDTVTNGEGTSRTFHPGDTSAVPSTTVHWHRNDGKDAVVLVAVDVFNAAGQTAKAK
jgi:quercetin dioxygenase-like cupin family protein